VIGACYSRVLPAKAANPQMAAYSKEAQNCWIEFGSLRICRFYQVFVGNRLLPGMDLTRPATVAPVRQLAGSSATDERSIWAKCSIGEPNIGRCS